MDLWLCQFFGVEYNDIKQRVLDGASDQKIASWIRNTGTSRHDYEYDWWHAYMVNRGFRDELADHLAKRKQEAGWQDRSDILSFMDMIDADEGRI